MHAFSSSICCGLWLICNTSDTFLFVVHRVPRYADLQDQVYVLRLPGKFIFMIYIYIYEFCLPVVSIGSVLPIEFLL
jgi:hypothetical protein